MKKGDATVFNIEIGDKVVRDLTNPSVEMTRWFDSIVYGIVTAVHVYPSNVRKKVCVAWYNHKGMRVKEFIYNVYEESKLFRFYEEG